MRIMKRREPPLRILVPIFKGYVRREVRNMILVFRIVVKEHNSLRKDHSCLVLTSPFSLLRTFSNLRSMREINIRKESHIQVEEELAKTSHAWEKRNSIIGGKMRRIATQLYEVE